MVRASKSNAISQLEFEFGSYYLKNGQFFVDVCLELLINLILLAKILPSTVSEVSVFSIVLNESFQMGCSLWHIIVTMQTVEKMTSTGERQSLMLKSDTDKKFLVLFSLIIRLVYVVFSKPECHVLKKISWSKSLYFKFLD